MEAERELKTMLAAVEGKSTEDLQLRNQIVFINAYLLSTMLYIRVTKRCFPNPKGALLVSYIQLIVNNNYVFNGNLCYTTT